MHRAPTRLRTLALASALPIIFALAACQPTAPVLPKVTTAKATCTTDTSRSIVVASSIVSSTRQLLAAAKADGLKLCGGGYRDAASQIAVRKANCGPTQYDIYEKPASQCTPPTAKPGTSQHEKGLAIDFESCQTKTSACYKWLAQNAKTYGLKNLPSEPWHWSTTGG
ncbi:MAG: Peptidoglycan-binding domain 1 protein [Ilumatobacteraceae bacterium]|nr:Peptidoglycan-binding domain 1 protein [Ilumatobacteraceae bacterium]